MIVAATLAFALLSSASQTSEPPPSPEPVPIEEWSLDRVSAMGVAIYRQDVAAWVSTDALLAHLAGAEPPPGMVGWIVVEEDGQQRVRYLRDNDGVLIAAFDVIVTEGRAGAVQEVNEPIPPIQQAQFRAIDTAGENIGRLRCAATMNAVVLDDPGSDGWLVWLLTPTTQAGTVPLGGHYRFRISADGSTMISRDMLSNSCFMAEFPSDEAPEALFFTQIVSDGPVETHVFLSLQNELPIYVIADDKLFEVDGADIQLRRESIPQ